eukprot:TRINITY_DN19340_c0_g1_i1.p1 TRINITY_DN19340_c0_g1~~TRINITY_DN19340_c0_g1_i1.p1  ORF type:complete len:703 (+),score=237.78 TRINITY_DN19340_c0_g1_i1:52-2160(+)
MAMPEPERRPAVVALRLSPAVGHVRSAVHVDKQKRALVRDDVSLPIDHVFDTDADSGQIYDSCVSPHVDSVLDGVQVCVAVYGKADTGRTFTMLGTPDNHGLIPRTIADLYTRASERECTQKVRYQIRVSSVQMLEGVIRDVINSENRVSAIHPEKDTQFIKAPGAEEIEASRDAAMELVDVSLENQVLSSRATNVFRFTVERRELMPDGTTMRTEGALHLLDLAASDPQDPSEQPSMVQGIAALTKMLRGSTPAASSDSAECAYLQPAMSGGNCVLSIILCCKGAADEDCWHVARGVKQVVCSVRRNMSRVEGAADWGLQDEPEQELPANWEVRYTEDGRAFYVHTVTQTTTWNDPRRATRRPGKKDRRQSTKRAHVLQEGERNFLSDPEPTESVHCEVALAVTDTDETRLLVRSERWPEQKSVSSVPLLRPDSAPQSARSSAVTESDQFLLPHSSFSQPRRAGSEGSKQPQRGRLEDEGSDLRLTEACLYSFVRVAKDAQLSAERQRDGRRAAADARRRELVELHRRVQQLTLRRDEARERAEEAERQAAEAQQRYAEAESSAAAAAEPRAAQPEGAQRTDGGLQALAELRSQLRMAEPLWGSSRTPAAGEITDLSGVQAALSECNQLTGMLVSHAHKTFQLRTSLRRKDQSAQQQNDDVLRQSDSAFRAHLSQQMQWLLRRERRNLPATRGGPAASGAA